MSIEWYSIEKVLNDGIEKAKAQGKKSFEETGNVGAIVALAPHPFDPAKDATCVYVVGRKPSQDVIKAFLHLFRENPNISGEVVKSLEDSKIPSYREIAKQIGQAVEEKNKGEEDEL